MGAARYAVGGDDQAATEERQFRYVASDRRRQTPSLDAFTVPHHRQQVLFGDAA